MGNYTGNAGDGLIYHIYMKFSTHDRDNDLYEDYNCAKYYKGAWWFKRCLYSHLNGEYENKSDGINWITIDRDEELKFVQMMIRPTEKCLRRISLIN
ncbi:unnamed protein product [Ceratitis capitata]|uniref:(Mediterranean fruit fly) hypothetical protein n=2 Tax=Ceratitis capitata TaxID=7213 RepID=A0A811UFJ9_CERCA|nr:unnamed protein product [Ceratitis capitata]